MRSLLTPVVPLLVWALVYPMLSIEADVELNICAIVEDGPTNMITNYRKLAAAIDVGLTEAKSILPSGVSFRLRFKTAGSQCGSRNDAFRSTLEFMHEKVTCNVLLGPGCDDAVADMTAIAKQRDIPLLTCPAADIATNLGKDRDQLLNLIRTCFSFSGMGTAFLEFTIGNQNYTNYAALMDTSDPFYFPMGARIRAHIQSSQLSLDTKYLRYDDMDTLHQENPVRVALLDVQNSARFVMLFGHALFVRKIMLEAYKLGMTNGEYIFTAFELYPSPTWGQFRFDLEDDDDRFAKEAYKSLLLVSVFDPEDQHRLVFEQLIRNVSRQKFGDQYMAFEGVDPVAIGYYSAVILYANAIREVSLEGGDFVNTSQILTHMKNVSYSSAAAASISLDDVGDVRVVYALRDFSIESEEYEVAYLLQAGVEPKMLQPIKLPCPDGLSSCGFPPNRPKCGFDGALCGGGFFSTPGGIAVLVALVVSLLLGVTGLLVMRRLRGHEDPFWWRMNPYELVAPAKGKSVLSLRKSDKSTTSLSNGEHKSMFSAFVTMTYGDAMLTVALLAEDTFRVTKSLLRELNQIHALRHQNLHRFVGLVVGVNGYITHRAGELCSRGALEEVLENENLKLDWSFKFSLMKDIAEGMVFLQSSSVGGHGFLSVISCLIDSRFVVKVTDYGVTQLRSTSLYAPVDAAADNESYRLLVWRAPELLRDGMPSAGTQKGDVYSFGIVLQQIILRTSPFELPEGFVLADQTSVSSKDIVMKVFDGNKPFYRPVIPPTVCSSELVQLAERCWAENPADRPTFVKVRDTVRKIAGSAGENIVDHLITEMEHYANDLENKVALQTLQFVEEKERTEKLLGQLLPATIAAALTKGETVAPELFEMVSLYFSDVVGFTSISAQGTAMDVVDLLNSLYTLFDAVIAHHDAYKVETIGDAYMISSGLPVRNGDRHAKEIANTAIHIVRELSSFKVAHIPNKKLEVRVGLHSGTCVAGIVGDRTPRYCLFGDTVKIGSRMESSGERRIFLEFDNDFSIVERGETNVKDVGVMMTYWLTQNV